MLAANSSIFTILAISFERYYAICKPLKAGYKCTRLRASIIIGIIWLLSCILTAPILNMARSDETIYIDGSVVRNCILETATYWNRMYVFVSMIAFFCLPLLVLMLVYWLIGRRLIRENVSMIDATRDNLIDNRSHRRQPNDTYDSSIGGSSYISSVFRRRFNAQSRRSFRALFKLSYVHGGGHTSEHNGKSAAGQRSIDFGRDNISKPEPICIARRGFATRATLSQSSPIGDNKRGNLRSAQAFSLDSRGNYQRNVGGQQYPSPERTNRSPTRGQPEARSFWSSIASKFDHDIRAQPSSIETTTTNATTSSSLPSSGVRGVEADHSRVSLMSKLKSEFRFLRNLLGGSDPSPDPDTISNKVNHTTIHTNNLLGGGLKSKLDDGGENQGGEPATIGLHKSQLSSHEFKRTDNRRLIDVLNYEGTKGLDEKLVSGEEINRQAAVDSKWISAGDHTQVGSKLRVMATGATSKLSKRDSLGATGSKRLSASLKVSNNDEKVSPPMKSRFKWIKGVSISSSTGSTHTNSTCLASDTGSFHYRHQNSPSPPRAAQNQQQVAGQKISPRDLGCEQNVGSYNPDTSCEKLVPLIEQKETQPDGGSGQPRGKTRSTDATVLRSNRRAGLNSRSSSTTYNEAENSSYSEESSSCSIAADFTSTRSWIESLSLQDQKNLTEPNQHRGQQRRLSQHEGEQQFLDDLIRSTRLESVHEMSSIYTENENGAQVLEVVMDEDGHSINIDGDQNEHLDSSWRAHSKIGATLSSSNSIPATNTRYDDGKALGMDSLDKRYIHDLASQSPDHVGDSNCDLIVSENSGQLGKANLVAMAQCTNGIESLRQNVVGKRSGSHPVVSCHKLAKLADGPVEVHCLQPEFMAVRDVSKKQQMDSRRQVVAMLAFVVACFFLLFFPYRVFTIWLIMSTEDQVQSLGMETYYNIAYFSRILIYLHSAINPIAYNLISTKFRRAFTSILLCRGASTRRNFNVDHRYVYKSKNQPNYQARSRIADCGSNKSPIAAKAST